MAWFTKYNNPTEALQPIGSGWFGKVYRVQWPGFPNPIILKVYRKLGFPYNIIMGKAITD